MAKKELDWGSLPFGYLRTDERYVSNFKDGAWDEGKMTSDDVVAISESACVLHYAQTCFEGLKAYMTRQGKVLLFRPDMNAKRMADTARRLEMPVFPEDRFVKAVVDVIKANVDWVPPFGSGAALYLRPVLFGTGVVMGIKPALEYQFRVFAMPVGPYFKSGIKPLAVKVSDYDRAAPHGTGGVKAGLNYAMSLYPLELAHKEGFSENIYPDSATRTYIEEAGGSNVILVDRDGALVVPKSETGSILPSITKRSLMHVAEHTLGMKVVERPVKISELDSFAEMGLCGTAAVISPVGKVNDHGKEICFPSGMTEMGPALRKLYDTLTGMQAGEIEAPKGWMVEVC